MNRTDVIKMHMREALSVGSPESSFGAGKNLGEIITAYRETYNLRRVKFALKTGYTATYIKMLEDNRTSAGKPPVPSPDAIISISQAMGEDPVSVALSLEPGLKKSLLNKLKKEASMTQEGSSYLDGRPLGSIIQEYRAQHKIKMADFAKRCGLSKAYISILEKNKRPDTGAPPVPSLDTIIAVAMGMGSEPDEILSQMGLQKNMAPIHVQIQEMQQQLSTCSNRQFLCPFEYIEMNQQNLMDAVRDGRLIILPFRAPKLGDIIYVYLKAYDMSVAHTITAVGGGIYTASSEAGGDITFSLFDIGHTVFQSRKTANRARPNIV